MDTLHYGTMAIIFRDQRSASTKFVRPHGLTEVFVLSKYYFWTQNAEARKEKEKTSVIFGNSSKVQHLSPCSCNKSALAQYQPYTKALQPNSGKRYSSTRPSFGPTKSRMPVFYCLTPWSFHAILRPSFFHLGLLQDQQKNTSPYHERMHGFIHSGIKEKLEMLPSIRTLPFEGMLPQVRSQALSQKFLGLPHQIPKSHGFI